MNVPLLFTRLRGMLQSANRSHISPAADAAGNAGPARGRARVQTRTEQVDGPTERLPLNGRGYTSRLHGSTVKGYNRANTTLPRTGTATKAVGW